MLEQIEATISKECYFSDWDDIAMGIDEWFDDLHEMQNGKFEFYVGDFCGDDYFRVRIIKDRDDMTATFDDGELEYDDNSGNCIVEAIKAAYEKEVSKFNKQ